MNKLKNMPIIPLRDTVIFPSTSIALDVGRAKTIETLSYAVKNKLRVVAVMQKDGEVEDVEMNDLNTYGTLCDVSKVIHNVNSMRVFFDGLAIVKIDKINDSNGIITAEISDNEAALNISDKELAFFKSVINKSIKKFSTDVDRDYPPHVIKAIKEADTADLLVNLASGLISPIYNKYEIFAAQSPIERLELLCQLLEEDYRYALKLHSIETSVEKKLSKNSRDYVLREQIKAIQTEIGDGEDNVKTEYVSKIDELKASDEIKEKLTKELERMSRMSESSPETALSRGYLDWVLSLPWGNMTEDRCDLKEVRNILDEDHYGIDDVKERIVEYLAVRQLPNSKMRGAAICLSGPPGVGKTSIAKSIARALGKEYISLTLGGVHDEAEIRGHRKTYIGAMPGRIMSSLAKAKTNNPVFLLDEIDKITKDMRGDPQSALLEVLDPNQNKEFRDNYLEIPYDLSNIMFIITANDVSSLDKPLLDRLELINMDGYTTDEKIAIASKYLIKKQTIAHGLDEGKLIIPDSVIREIIEGYTNESGVRELERKIATIARKVVYKMVSEGATEEYYDIGLPQIKDYLGARQNSNIDELVGGEVGRVTGLAWTALGGVTLNIEAVTLQGSGELKLTGSLGDVMKESAITALSLVKRLVAPKGFGVEFFKSHDIHVHVPMGAVPKDGPSAGVTMATAIYSAVTNINVADKLAMTGEISLSGRVLPIGGLKEKSLAAHRLGINTIIIPKANERDLDKIPKTVLNDIKFVLAERIEEVLKLAVNYVD